ncbi:peptidase T [Niabella ginsenosidivorans]|uniref:Peptidase T n=1 Tax=Niabella ginsenosidivorans TaxID=1176587 RepID=A0A1A9I3F9_9BACT|nr:peptidase T [Niabella ginsenosidivorans]ANH81250.1 peptidase T [Niabella ginsenosidivorans]
MDADYSFTVAERFLQYVTIDTQSDPHSTTVPSTEKQKELGRVLADELRSMGVADAELDDQGYVYATLPSTSDKKVPVICFCSHMDTSSDCSGTHVKPIVHQNYDGKDIVLPDDPKQVIRPADHPYLKTKKGEDIITASGTTLLGADDKAGVAIIMDLAHYLTTHPEVKHGTIRILFTPDEEIGRGVDHVNLERLGADFGYTLDGGERGSYTDETFSANGATVTFYGNSIHPGYAKNKLVNAMKVAATFLDLLPKDSFSPETTEDREGFVHPVHMEGTAEKAVVSFIIRDFETARLKLHEARLEQFAKQAVGRYTGSRYEFESKEQYRNMKEIVDRHPEIGEYVKTAMERSGVVFKKHSARGGTDGSRLSFMGVPFPDIFTGEMAFHGKQEYVSIQDMQKSVETLIHLVQVWEEKSS